MDLLNELMNDSFNFEMATLKKKRSGLPINLYLDDSGSYINCGHSPQIKFQHNKNDSSDTNNMISMTISDNPEIPVEYKQQLDGFNEKDITAIKQFVMNNKIILLRLCDANDEYDFQDFLNDMII